MRQRRERVELRGGGRLAPLRLLSALALSLILLPAPVAAQDATDRLRASLEAVPVAAVADLVSYVDYRAMEAARPGAAQPGSVEEWQALRAADDVSYQRWMAALHGLVGGSGDIPQAFVRAGERWPDLLGIDFFDIDRELRFGQPPGDGLVLDGRFDPDAIAVTHQGRGFTASPEGDRVLICPVDGCDEGMAVDISAMERGDPFGGKNGQRHPLLVTEARLVSSAAIETVEAMSDAMDGAIPSLADVPAVEPLLGAIPADALLRQALFAPPTLFLADVASIMQGVSSQEDLEAALERYAMEPIPAYDLVLFADSATADEQVAYVILAYASEADAHSAAAVIPGRIETLDSFMDGRPVRELFEERGVTSIDTTVLPGPAGAGAATVLAFHGPPPTSEPTDGGSGPEASGAVYRLLMQMLFRRDLYWLATSAVSLE